VFEISVVALKVAHVTQYTLSLKKLPTCLCPYLRQILTDFHISFAGTLRGQVAIKYLLNIPPHLNCVATLPCEI